MTRHGRRRRVLRALKICEISGVDAPAQEGATVAIMKRSGAEALSRAQDMQERLAARRDELQEELDDFVAAENGGATIRELIADISRLEADVKQRRNETMEKSIQVDALDNTLEHMAKSQRRDAETDEQSYTRLSIEDVGFRALLTKRQELADERARSLEPTQGPIGRVDRGVAKAAADTIEGRIQKRVDQLRGPGETPEQAYTRVISEDAETRRLYSEYSKAQDAVASAV